MGTAVDWDVPAALPGLAGGGAFAVSLSPGEYLLDEPEETGDREGFRLGFHFLLIVLLPVLVLFVLVSAFAFFVTLFISREHQRPRLMRS